MRKGMVNTFNQNRTKNGPPIRVLRFTPLEKTSTAWHIIFRNSENMACRTRPHLYYFERCILFIFNSFEFQLSVLDKME